MWNLLLGRCMHVDSFNNTVMNCTRMWCNVNKCYFVYCKLWLVINRAAMGRARFLLCTGFISRRSSSSSIFFVGDQTQTSARPNHDRDWITQPGMLIRQKLLEQWCTGNVTDNVFFVVNNIYFSLGFFEALASKGILSSLKKRYDISHGMRWRCSFHFRYATSKIVLLQVYFARSDGH